MSKRTLLILSATALAALLPIAAAAQTVKTFPAAGLKTIEVEAGAGDIVVQKVSGKDVSVTVTKNDPDKCDITMEVQGSVLVLQAKALSNWHSWFLQLGDCQAGFNVQAPANLALEASAGSGDVSVSGLNAGLTTNAGSGAINLDHVSGDVTARAGSGSINGQVSSNNVSVWAGSGDVSLTGLLGSADVKAGSGSIKLEWAKTPKSGNVLIKNGSGDVTLSFPPGTKLISSLMSGSGRTLNEIGDTPGAGFTVSGLSGSGDISIKKSGN